MVFFFSDSQLHQFVDWSYPMPNHRQTYHVLRRPRKPQYYQQNWRRFVPNGFTAHRSYGGQAILWEIDKVDRQIHALQSEINVLQQQLNIIRNYCAPSTETFGSQQANQGPRYIRLTIFSANCLRFYDALIVRFYFICFNIPL